MTPSKLSLLTAILLLGCGPPMPDQLIEGRWVRYHYWADAGAPCPEALEEMDRFIDALAARTQRPAPGGFRIDYYRLRTTEQVRELCQPHSLACAVGSKVYSTTVIQDHELTHAFLSRLGQPPLMFTEGIAMGFGCGATRYVGEPFERVHLGSLLDDDAWSEALTPQNYQSAGSFVRQLVDLHGLEAFLDFYEATPSGVTRAQLDAQFRKAFGEELSAALTRWSEGPAPRDGEFCMPVDDRCEAAPDVVVATGAAGVGRSANVSCVEEVTMLEVVDAPMTRLRFITEKEGRRLRIRPCDATGSPAQQLLYVYSNAGSTRAMEGRWTELWATLKPGRYSLTVDSIPTLKGELHVGGTSSIEVAPQPRVLAASCALEPVQLGYDTWSIGFLDDSAPADAVVSIQTPSDRRLAGLFGYGFPAATICRDCAAPTECLEVAAGQTSSGWLRSPTTSLRISPSADGGSTFLKLVLEPPL